MMSALNQFYELLLLLPLQQLGGGAVLLAFYAGLPILFGLLVTWWHWRSVWRALLTWYGLLFGGFFLMSFNINHMLHGGLMYGMFFSVVAVPVFAVMYRVSDKIRNWFCLGGCAE